MKIENKNACVVKECNGNSNCKEEKRERVGKSVEETSTVGEEIRKINKQTERGE